ncbi:MAG: mobile mystery protein A [Ignavibacteriales bacterium]|nr:mobile mystery protein A [Ignavibacteriales bacterium]
MRIAVYVILISGFSHKTILFSYGYSHKIDLLVSGYSLNFNGTIEGDMASKIPKQKLLIDQLEKKMKRFAPVETVETPQRGWIHTIRTAMRMSMRQLGKRIGKTAQTVNDLERAESSGSITIKSLREAGRALDMKLVYGFVPCGESLEKLIEKRALQVASEIVTRTSQSMKLEDQENVGERIAKAIKERASEIKREMPKYLWD